MEALVPVMALVPVTSWALERPLMVMVLVAAREMVGSKENISVVLAPLAWVDSDTMGCLKKPPPAASTPPWKVSATRVWGRPDEMVGIWATWAVDGLVSCTLNIIGLWGSTVAPGATVRVRVPVVCFQAAVCQKATAISPQTTKVPSAVAEFLRPEMVSMAPPLSGIAVAMEKLTVLSAAVVAVDSVTLAPMKWAVAPNTGAEVIVWWATGRVPEAWTEATEAVWPVAGFSSAMETTVSEEEGTVAAAATVRTSWPELAVQAPLLLKMAEPAPVTPRAALSPVREPVRPEMVTSCAAARATLGLRVKVSVLAPVLRLEASATEAESQ
mmetsp:Transcript_111/g.354  ORF Transcript_111/g.354 Transcript_111/m.354 type:complete len:327 (-) Transcript_111:4164-5144(-)